MTMKDSDYDDDDNYSYIDYVDKNDDDGNNADAWLS